MRLCRGNGAQVHNSERDPETRTAACETQLGATAFYISLFGIWEIFWTFHMVFPFFLGNQSGSVQYQHRRALCHPQRVYPFTVLQVSLLMCWCGLMYVRASIAFSLNISSSGGAGMNASLLSSLVVRHLLVNPRDRRVVIIESILCPSHFRETLTKVFFKQFEVTKPDWSASYWIHTTCWTEVFVLSLFRYYTLLKLGSRYINYVSICWQSKQLHKKWAHTLTYFLILQSGSKNISFPAVPCFLRCIDKTLQWPVRWWITSCGHSLRLFLCVLTK